MKYQFIDEKIAYNGNALQSHWIYRNFGLLGEAVVAFVGPCDVPIENMVDLEDVRHDDAIYSQNMLHFLIELFGVPLREGVTLQRLFIAILQAKIQECLDAQGNPISLRRFGDDIFVNDTQKLSVSICTVSPTSSIIHTGLNIESEGAPVEAAGLGSDLGIDDIKGFALSAMRQLVEEWEDINRSCCKVKSVV